MRDCKSKCCGIKCPSEFDQELSDWCGGVRERGTQDKSRYGQFVNDMSECCKSESPVRPPGGGPQTGGGRVREREGERERVARVGADHRPQPRSRRNRYDTSFRFRQWR